MNILLILTLTILNLSIIFYFKKFIKIINIFDIPDKKLKLHKKKTPILGGLILFLNYCIIFTYQLFFSDNFIAIDKNLFLTLDYLSILLLIFGFFIIGLYDDKYNLSPNKKLILSISIIFISLALSQNLLVEKISLSFYEHKIFFKNFAFFFTIFSILILINSLNFYDGINGQSCFFFLLVFIFLLLKSNMNIFYLYSVLIILFVLILNLKNKLFLGDGGILLISIIISISLILEHNINKNIVYADEIFFLLLFPGIDLVRLTIIRISNKQNPFIGDRNHIHHLLNRKLSITISNFVLMIFSITPIFLFSYLNLNFYASFLIFLFIYITLILFLVSDGKNLTNQKKNN